MSKRLDYLPRLDSLRAIAALMVLLVHYLSLKKSTFAYGGNGVEIFFVISGFLITGILLSQKNETSLPRYRLFGSFVVKRALRLFPAYYLYLAFLYVLHVKGSLWLCDKGDFWHYLTYTQNILFMQKAGQSSLLFHTWSLSVEEQFYLVWPLLILFLPRKAELPLLSSVFMLGILSKIYFIVFFHCPGTVKGITLIHFDTLGAGALLAYFVHYKKERVLGFFNRFADPIFFVSFIASVAMTWSGVNDAFFLPLSVTIMSAALVFICSVKETSLLHPLMNVGVLKKLGKISYGFYLFHKPVPFLFGYFMERLGFHLDINPFLLLIIYLSIALSVAIISYHFFERPILRIKARFDF